MPAKPVTKSQEAVPEQPKETLDEKVERLEKLVTEIHDKLLNRSLIERSEHATYQPKTEEE